MQTETITSVQNPRLKELRRLARRRQRERSGRFMAEGEDMIGEALRRGVTPEAVYFVADALGPGDPPLALLPAATELVPVGREALAHAGSLGSGSRVIGVWRQRWSESAAVAVEGGSADRRLGALPAVLFLHELQDPGNVGAIIRSAYAFGARAAVLSPGCADPFGPKAVRAAMGAIFALPLVRASFEEARAALGPGWRAVALVPSRGRPLRESQLDRPCLLVLGAERAGLPDRIVAACEEVAHVPLAEGGAESLNVAMVATLCLYEATLHRLPPTDA